MLSQGKKIWTLLMIGILLTAPEASDGKAPKKKRAKARAPMAWLSRSFHRSAADLQEDLREIRHELDVFINEPEVYAHHLAKTLNKFLENLKESERVRLAIGLPEAWSLFPPPQKASRKF